MKKQPFKQRLHNFFESDSIYNTYYKAAVVLLILLSIVMLLGEYQFIDMGLTTAEFIFYDLIIASIFLTDYLVRFYAAPSKKKFVIDFYNIIDIIAILPSFIGFGDTKSIRALRFLRFLRLLRLFKILKQVRIVEQHFKEEAQVRQSAAHDELQYYKTLLRFYRHCTKGTAQKHLASIRDVTKKILSTAKQKSIQKNAITEQQLFTVAFADLVEQAHVLLDRFDTKNPAFHTLKLLYVLKELKDLISSEHTSEEVPAVETITPTRNIQITRLVKASLRDVFLTFSIALGLNFILKLTPLYDKLGSVIDNLILIEAGMGALIVFITSFNLSYAISKRGKTDLALIDFTNLLNVYARRIKSIIERKEKNVAKKKKIFLDTDYLLDMVGYNILHGSKESNHYHLKFDPVIFQCLKATSKRMEPYVKKLDYEERNRFYAIEDSLIETLNSFQIISTIRVPQIFDTLNSWLIRITYFILTTIAPYSLIPRLFVINVMQRAFFRTAQQTDNAIFTNSFASLPIEERVVRRLNRISRVLSTH